MEKIYSFIMGIFVFLLEPDLPDQAIEIFEKNQTMQSTMKFLQMKLFGPLMDFNSLRNRMKITSQKPLVSNKEGKYPLKESLKMENPTGHGLLFSDGRPRWKGNKKEG